MKCKCNNCLLLQSCRLSREKTLCELNQEVSDLKFSLKVQTELNKTLVEVIKYIAEK